jgi:hypothetical protein
MNPKHRCVSLIVALLAGVIMLAAPATALAQEGETAEVTALESLTVRVWPEFDQPSALVFLIAELPGSTLLPAQVRFALPDGVQVNAVAYPDAAGGGLLTAQYEQQGSEVLVTAETGTLWIEFYDTALQFDGDQRSYTLAWTSPLDIALVTFDVQTPYGGRSMALETAAEVSASTDQYGLPTYSFTQTGVSAGDALSLSFSYTKGDNTLSADVVAQQPPTAPEITPTPTVTGQGTSPAVIAALVVGGVLLIGGGIYWYLQSTGAIAPLRVGDGGGGRGERFCTQCGKSIGAADRFCRHCGAGVRR